MSQWNRIRQSFDMYWSNSVIMRKALVHSALYKDL